MGGYRLFAVIAEMRTGSNFLEASLNALDGVHCHGELFNTQFVGRPGRSAALGVTMAVRRDDPGAMLDALAGQDGGLHGFRYFPDHDPRVLARIVADPACAKILLSRDPLECYVSRKIARATGQWRLGDLGDRKTARVRFDADEFETYLFDRAAFRDGLRTALLKAGQAAFELTYEDLGDIEVINGLAAFLGVGARLQHLPGGVKKQNPEPLSALVENPDEMARALAAPASADPSPGRSYERRRGPAVRKYLAAAHSALVFQPVPGGPTAQISGWLSDLDEAPPVAGYTQKSLRDWQARQPGHRVFTVISHPMARAFAAYRALLSPEHGDLRDRLAEGYGVTVHPPDADADRLRGGFTGFLAFLEGNLAGQTSIATQPDWASQIATVQGFSSYRPPDLILRSADLSADLPALARAVGHAGPPAFASRPPDPALAAILTPRIERMARRAYRRDYLAFGFGDMGSGGL